ncbi:hypothetical protein DMB37_39960 [Nocardia sp. CS682]|nr:hypothetical protein DMB37_39960 [Nocardia sp. CS682]
MLCLLSGFLAIWAFAGALGLMTGVLSLGAAIDDRIPFHSAVFGGLMLAVIVGLPMAVAGMLAARDDARTPLVAMAAGAALVGWIVVQVLLIREFSWLQPICVVLGLAVLFLGATARRGDIRR